MTIRTPERGSFSLFRRLSENPASGGAKLTRLSRVFGAAALLAVAAGCGSAGYEPNGRRLGGSDITSPDGTVGHGDDAGDVGSGSDIGRIDDGGGADGRDAGTADAGRRDGGESDAGGPDGRGPDAGSTPDAGPNPDAGHDAGTDGGTPPICPAEACREGIGACEQVGNVLYDADCIPTGCSVSGGEPAPAEDCNNALDDDCNGEVNNGCACDPDESTACYTGGEDTRSQGICHDGNSTCGADGRWGACEGQQTPLEEEICGNGFNEDCDLETDEGCGGGVECFSGEGICRTAGVTRADGSCDAVPGIPEETDLCGDGLDNDCVNGIDDGCVCPAENTQLCYQGGEDTLNVGVCRPGTQTCIDGRRWSPVCDGQVLPSAEQCNGEDDNCNDETDENITRPCSTVCGEGTEICRDGSFQNCNAPQPQPETCNGADDNCNDRIDEDIAPRVCSTICGDGTEVCRDGSFQDCNASTPQPETCNNADDDCDTLTDEDIAPRACSSDCGDGTEVCIDGAFRDCNAPQPQPEECDGEDNNCNDIIDEDFPGMGAECFVGTGFCRRIGELICEPGHPTGDVHCSELTPGDPRPETCNGVDDNCNEATDEEFPEMDTPCNDGIGECLRTGTLVCTPGDPRGDITCSATAAAPDIESCNRLDDDCDDATDNGCGFHQVECATTPVSRWDSDADAYRIEDPMPDCGADGYRPLVIRDGFLYNFIVTNASTLRIGRGNVGAANVASTIPPLPADLRTLSFGGVNADSCPEPRADSDWCYTNALGAGAVNVFRVRR